MTIREDVWYSYQRYFHKRQVIYLHELTFYSLYILSLSLYIGKLEYNKDNEEKREVVTKILQPLTNMVIANIPVNDEFFSSSGEFTGSSIGIELIQPWAWYIPRSVRDNLVYRLYELAISLKPERDLLEKKWKREINKRMFWWYKYKEGKKTDEELVEKARKYGIDGKTTYNRKRLIQILTHLVD